MDKLIQNLRNAPRSFASAPRFTFAAVAAAVPARRAASTNPVDALRHD